MDIINKTLKISIVAPCYNERDNIYELYTRLTAIMQGMQEYDYEIIIGDNHSTDGTIDILKKIASKDKKFKVIFNSNNFGQMNSPFNTLLHATGDAVIAIAGDLQDPPELIHELIQKWKIGYNVVVAVKAKSKEGILMSFFRKAYYSLLSHISDTNKLIPNFTGFGLYDRKFMEALKKYTRPNPYFRGLVSEIGFKRLEIEYVQEKRKHGKSKNNFFTLYDYAMNGFVNNSKLPLRLAAFCGFCLAGVSLMIALAYFIYKLLYWETFTLGLAPLVIGMFFFSAMQLIFIGIIGEYIGAILTQVKNHPLVIEEEKLNFDEKPESR